jgi:hypothetical protein
MTNFMSADENQAISISSRRNPNLSAYYPPTHSGVVIAFRHRRRVRVYPLDMNCEWGRVFKMRHIGLAEVEEGHQRTVLLFRIVLRPNTRADVIGLVGRVSGIYQDFYVREPGPTASEVVRGVIFRRMLAREL